MIGDRPMWLRFTSTVVLSIVCLAVPACANYKVGEATNYQIGSDAYERGDYATALREWQPLAKQGEADAQVSLGWLYSNGHGVPQDYAQAWNWYRTAARQGNQHAQVNLGTCYALGQGVPQDYLKALGLFQLAADQGNALAQVKLGGMYEEGRGVRHDLVQAYKWYYLVSASGNNAGIQLRKNLAKHMAPAQIAEAQDLALLWKMKGQ
jgi:TPR repeat protein